MVTLSAIPAFTSRLAGSGLPPNSQTLRVTLGDDSPDQVSGTSKMRTSLIASKDVSETNKIPASPAPCFTRSPTLCARQNTLCPILRTVRTRRHEGRPYMELLGCAWLRICGQVTRCGPCLTRGVLSSGGLGALWCGRSIVAMGNYWESPKTFH